MTNPSDQCIWMSMFNMRHELLGESIFTSFRTWRGKVYGLDYHLQRLFKGIKRCYGLDGLGFEQFKDHFFQHEGFEDFLVSHPNHNIRLTFYAEGSADLNKFKFSLSEICLDLKARKLVETQPSLRLMALKYPFSDDYIPAKSGSYFYHLDARKLALRAGYEDAVYTNNRAEVLELSTSNIFFLDKKGEYFFPKNKNILNGVTQNLFISFLENRGCQIHFESIRLNDLGNFVKAYALNSVSLLRQVTAIEDYQFSPDFDKKLYKEFLSYLEETYS